MSADEFLGAVSEKIFDVFRTEAQELADLDSSEARLLARGVVAHPTSRYAQPFCYIRWPEQALNRGPFRGNPRFVIELHKTLLNNQEGFFREKPTKIFERSVGRSKAV
jgi:hypothetical protein